MIYKIEDKDGNKYETDNLREFCEDEGITRRLLQYTDPKWKGTGKRYQDFHKGFRIVEVLDEKEDGLVEEKINMFKQESFPFGENEEQELEYQQLAEEYTKLHKKYQNQLDQNRIIRKYNRSDARQSNIRDAILNDLKNITKYDIENLGVRLFENEEKELIIQISDTHFNEVVESKNNIYNFDVALKRMAKLFSRAIEICDAEYINKVNILMTGDLVNLSESSHGMDKLLSNEETRSKGMKIGFEIISSCLDMLLNEGIEVSMASILGNEGRNLGKEKMSNVNKLATDSFDYMLYVMLQVRYEGIINFINNSEEIETMVNVNGKNIILLHGHNIRHNNIDKEMSNVKLRWYEKTGVIADYCLFGHIHSTLISPNYARSGSLVGSNSYSDVGLNIPFSKASQNISIVGDTIETRCIILD